MNNDEHIARDAAEYGYRTAVFGRTSARTYQCQRQDMSPK